MFVRATTEAQLQTTTEAQLQTAGSLLLRLLRLRRDYRQRLAIRALRTHPCRTFDRLAFGVHFGAAALNFAAFGMGFGIAATSALRIALFGMGFGIAATSAAFGTAAAALSIALFGTAAAAFANFGMIGMGIGAAATAMAVAVFALFGMGFGIALRSRLCRRLSR